MFRIIFIYPTWFRHHHTLTNIMNCTVYSHQPPGSRELWLLSSKLTPSSTVPEFFTQLSKRNKEEMCRLDELNVTRAQSDHTLAHIKNGKPGRADTTIWDSLWGLTKTLSRRQLLLPLSSEMEAVDTSHGVKKQRHFKHASFSFRYQNTFLDLIYCCVIRRNVILN